MIQWVINICLFRRYWFWRLIVPALGGKLGKGVQIYEGVKLYLTRTAGIFIGNNCLLQKGAVLSASDAGKIILHDHVYVGEYSVIQSKQEIEIGRDSILAAHTSVVDFDHSYADPDALFYDQKIVGKKVTIQNNVWIGAGCKILKGVTIGEGSVVGAGSVVTKNIPPYSVCVGVPAKVIRERKSASSPSST